jgi:hypothetical protein
MKNGIISLIVSFTFIMSGAIAQTVTLKQLGKTNEYFQAGNPVYYNRALYTFNYGALYKTELDSGRITRLGNSVYKNIRFFFAINNKLHIIETDGSMLGIDPNTGDRKPESPINAWINVMQVIVVGNSLYSFENGVCYKHTALDPNSRKQIGKADFYELGNLYRSDSRLFSIIGSNLYQINTTNGEWNKIGKGKAWRAVRSGAALNDKFYSIESDGSLYETTLADGTKKELDKTQFIKGGYLFAESGKLYAIVEGTLYEVILA